MLIEDLSAGRYKAVDILLLMSIARLMDPRISGVPTKLRKIEEIGIPKKMSGRKSDSRRLVGFVNPGHLAFSDIPDAFPEDGVRLATLGVRNDGAPNSLLWV